MSSIMWIILLIGSVIAVSAKDLKFPHPDYYGGREVAVVEMTPYENTISPELREVMNKKRMPAKDIYGGIYIPLNDATKDELDGIQRKMLSEMFYVPVPVADNGFRLYPIGIDKIAGFDRYIYSDEQYHKYAKV